MQLHAGYILDGVKKYLDKNNGPLDWKDVLFFLSVFELDSKEDLSTMNSDSLFAVADNIISRGLPTKPSLLIEREFSNKLNWTMENISSIGEISFPMIQEIEDNLTLLRRSFIPIDPRIKQISFKDVNDNDSVFEKKFFDERLSQIFGEYVTQLIEMQRDIPSIIKYGGNQLTQRHIDKANDFVDRNAVDFCFQFPKNNTKKRDGLVVEIDDDTHNPETNHTQGNFDAFRDSVVSGHLVNWQKTVRLKQYGGMTEINMLPPNKIDEINNFLTHPFSIQAKKNCNDPLLKTELGLEAMQAALAPFAIARIQKTIIQLLKANVLSMNAQSWNIAILERDVPCGHLALMDLKEMLSNLKILKNDQPLPSVNIRVYSTQEFRSCALNNELDLELYSESAEAISEFNADVLLDVSMLQRKGLTKPSQIFLERIGNPVSFIIRTCHAPKSERKVSIAPVTQYPSLFDENAEPVEERMHAMKYFLGFIFRKSEFRKGQLEIIDRALQTKSVIGLLPTGSGKSLCYQICVLLQPGITIIVDPLISLMKDQEQNLLSMEITCIDKINSEINSPAERSFRIKRLAEGFDQFVFVSPERFQTQEFRDALIGIRAERKIKQLVIDEAHCVSEWGHDFRPAYLHLGKNARNLIDENIIMYGLTGTASFDVLSDVAREVNINLQDIIESNTFDRKELKFSIQEKRYKPEQADSAQKSNILIRVLSVIHRFFGYETAEQFFTQKNENGYVNCGIVFCPHGSTNFNEYSPFSVGTVAGNLINHYATNAPFNMAVRKYSGKLTNLGRETVQNEFKNNQCQILVSTCAFGMGIDKPNIRFVIHYSCPQSIEAYYQEAGRAGRDRNKALCISLFSDDKIFFKRGPDGFGAPYIHKLNDKAFLDAETSGAEAILLSQNGVLMNPDFDWRNNPVNDGGHLFNYTNFILSNKNSNNQIAQVPKPGFVVANDTTIRHYFQEINFPGKEVEQKIFGGVIGQLNFQSDESTVPFNIQYKGMILNDGNNGNGYVERGIYRLSIIGAIEDYIKDYNANQYLVKTKKLTDVEIIENMEKYVSRYKSRAIVNNVRNEILNYVLPGGNNNVLYKAIFYLIDFIYENIERQRRNALREFVRVLRIGSANIERFREEMDNYFNSRYLPVLREYATNFTIDPLWQLITEVGTDYNLIRHLHGATTRLLITYDENLLFQMLRSYTTFFHPEFNKDEAKEYFRAFESSHFSSDFGNPDRKTVGSWMDRFQEELISRQPGESDNISESICSYELSWLKSFNERFLSKEIENVNQNLNTNAN